VLPIAACSRAESAPAPLSDRDRAAIRANDSAYVTAWMRDDTTGVLATLTADPILIPGGLEPLRGQSAAKGFWWPSDGSHTKLTAFDRTVEEIDGAGDVAFVRGTDSLRFTYTKGASIQASAMRSVTLAVVRRQSDGTWKIARMMWATVTH
jgi:ketosteroid isomerase-like protein